ncbi:MAG: Flp pilus assembly complex ATPase component TadA, partial [Draconibacterium sp.]|nr:Flp pilus assembly complex ATPase component TadA [Draconibacterium sp.]
TLHTNDSVSAITRMMDMGIESYKLAAALVGVVAQRLVRTICPHCRTSYYPSEEYLSALHYQGDRRRSVSKGEGCLECFDSGFQGRIGIYEVLPANADLRRLIAQEAGLETIMEYVKEQNYPTLLRCGLELAEPNMILSVYATNLLDEQYVTSGGNTGVMFGIPTFVPGAPRMFGAKLSWKF